MKCRPLQKNKIWNVHLTKLGIIYTTRIAGSLGATIPHLVTHTYFCIQSCVNFYKHSFLKQRNITPTKTIFLHSHHQLNMMMADHSPFHHPWVNSYEKRKASFQVCSVTDLYFIISTSTQNHSYFPIRRIEQIIKDMISLVNLAFVIDTQMGICDPFLSSYHFYL